MKIKEIVAVFAGIMAAANVLAQGQIVFRNTPTSAVIDGTTGLPVAYGVAVAGLYFSTDLTATPDPGVATDAFILTVTTPIAPVPSFAGVYSGGTVTLPGVIPGQEVLVQVRGWSAQYSTYADAFNSTDALIGASNLMQIQTGGGPYTITIPSDPFPVESFTLTPVPEPRPYQLLLLAALLSGVWFAAHRTRGQCVK